MPIGLVPRICWKVSDPTLGEGISAFDSSCPQSTAQSQCRVAFSWQRWLNARTRSDRREFCSQSPCLINSMVKHPSAISPSFLISFLSASWDSISDCKACAYHSEWVRDGGHGVWDWLLHLVFLVLDHRKSWPAFCALEPPQTQLSSRVVTCETYWWGFAKEETKNRCWASIWRLRSRHLADLYKGRKGCVVESLCDGLSHRKAQTWRMAQEQPYWRILCIQIALLVCWFGLLKWWWKGPMGQFAYIWTLYHWSTFRCRYCPGAQQKRRGFDWFLV